MGSVNSIYKGQKLDEVKKILEQLGFTMLYAHPYHSKTNTRGNGLLSTLHWKHGIFVAQSFYLHKGQWLLDSSKLNANWFVFGEDLRLSQFSNPMAFKNIHQSIDEMSDTGLVVNEWDIKQFSELAIPGDLDLFNSSIHSNAEDRKLEITLGIIDLIPYEIRRDIFA